MNRVRTLGIAVLFSAACGSPTSSATIAFTLTANPNPIAGALCTGCGSGSTDRWSITVLTVTETAGVAGNVTSVAMTLRDASGAVVAQGEFDAAGVTQLAGGSNRLAARGTLVISNVGPHYAAAFAGRPGTLTFVVKATDEKGNQITNELAVPVAAM